MFNELRGSSSLIVVMKTLYDRKIVTEMDPFSPELTGTRNTHTFITDKSTRGHIVVNNINSCLLSSYKFMRIVT